MLLTNSYQKPLHFCLNTLIPYHFCHLVHWDSSLFHLFSICLLLILTKNRTSPNNILYYKIVKQKPLLSSSTVTSPLTFSPSLRNSFNKCFLKPAKINLFQNASACMTLCEPCQAFCGRKICSEDNSTLQGCGPCPWGWQNTTINLSECSICQPCSDQVDLYDWLFFAVIMFSVYGIHLQAIVRLSGNLRSNFLLWFQFWNFNNF